MSNVLLLVHRIPYPPDKGDKIRSYNLLKFLSDGHRVFLGAFVDDPSDGQYKTDLEAECAEVFLCPLSKPRSLFGAASALVHTRSLSVGFYRDTRMYGWVQDILARENIDAIVAFSSTMAQYFPAKNEAGPVLIADYVDVDSDKWLQYSNESSWPRSLLYRYEAVALAKWEEEVLNRANAVCVVSEAERQIVPGLSVTNPETVQVVPNGVDTKFFDASGDWPDPYAGNRQVVVFTGAMDYHANVDGVCWFAEEVWPNVLQQLPAAEFFIVGSKPAAAVRALNERPGITVTGRVPDVRPYLRHARVAVAPLRLARGVQNKVLEALAMNRQVIATPEALRGLHGERPSSALEASSAASFARNVIGVLTAPNGVECGAGPDYVREYFGWERNLAPIDELIQSGRATGHPRPETAGASGA